MHILKTLISFYAWHVDVMENYNFLNNIMQEVANYKSPRRKLNINQRPYKVLLPNSKMKLVSRSIQNGSLVNYNFFIFHKLVSLSQTCFAYARQIA